MKKCSKFLNFLWGKLFVVIVISLTFLYMNLSSHAQTARSTTGETIYWWVDGTTFKISNVDNSNGNTPSGNFVSEPDRLPSWSSDSLFDRKSITSVVVEGKVTPLSTISWFQGFSNPDHPNITFDLRNLDASAIKSMTSMFAYNAAWTSLDLSSLSMTNMTTTTDMIGMFSGCTSLTELNISNFDISNVTSTNYMFNNCTSLTTLHTPKTMGSVNVKLPNAGCCWRKSDGNSLATANTLTSSEVGTTLTRIDEHTPSEGDYDCRTALNCTICHYEIAAAQTNHDYNYSNNGDGTHTITCKHVGCNFSTTENHSYDETSGNCSECNQKVYASVIANGEKTYYLDLASAITAANNAGTATITLLADVETNNTVEIKVGKTITLDLNNHVLKYSNESSSNSVITVRGTLTLTDLSENKTPHIITPYGETTPITLTTAGGVVTGGTGTDAMFGGGICVDRNATFHLEAGIIAGNSCLAGWGGGICVKKDGNFTMTGGEVSYNTVGMCGGGGISVDMSDGISIIGGKICNNKAIKYMSSLNGGGGISIGTGSAGTVNLEAQEPDIKIGGNVIITGNTSEVSGGGIYVHSNANLNIVIGENAIISENTATEYGGGIYIHSNSLLTLNGDAIISNNSAAAGGGLFLYNGTKVTISGNVSINDNTSTSGGAGIYTSSNSAMNLFGGTITGNNCNNSGGIGGLFFSGSTFNVQGTPKVYGNTVNGAELRDIYIYNGVMNITGELVNGEQYAQLHVYKKSGVITSGYSTNNSAINPTQVFKSDFTNVCISLNDTNDVLFGAHTLSQHEATSAICSTGNEEYWSCSNCNKYFNDSNATQEIEKKDWFIPATHNYSKWEDETPATCSSTGTKGHYTCLDCKKTFDNKYIENADLTISLDSNNHTALKYLSNGDGTHKHYCSDCSKIIESSEGCSGGTATCEHKATCEVCNQAYGELGAHDWESATCTEPKTCKVCGATEGPALGHQGGTATCEHKATCEVCNQEYGELGAHDWAVATCTEPKTCKACGQTEGVALGHQGGTATCEQKAICEVCNQAYGELGNHTLEKHNEEAATCTTAGNIEYWSCKVCEKHFSNEAGTTEITDKTSVVLASHHTLEHHEAKTETCTEAGNKEYWNCTACDKYFSDVAGITEITDKTSVILASHHTLEHHSATSATCSTTGSVEYWSCTVCEKYYSNATGTTEIVDKTSIVTETLAHHWEDWIVSKEPTETESGLKKRGCSTCDEEETEVIPALGIIDYPEEKNKKGLSGGAIAGISIGSILLVLIIVYALGYFLLYRRGKLDNKRISIIYAFLPRGKAQK